MNEKVVEIAKMMQPSSYAVRAPYTKHSIVPYQSMHHMDSGAIRVDPATSVVNKSMQSMNVPHVSVVGGSAFPQRGAVGPTETTVMLAG
jgi:gluconate 2-dehydrogenase alpha chain